LNYTDFEKSQKNKLKRKCSFLRMDDEMSSIDKNEADSAFKVITIVVEQ
jgi:hypothetical protein